MSAARKYQIKPTMIDQHIESASKLLKLASLVGGLGVSAILAVLSFGAQWKNVPERITTVESKLENLNRERAADREILIRIDERVNQLHTAGAKLR